MHRTADGYRFEMVGEPGTPMLAFLPGHRLRASNFLPMARALVAQPQSPFGQVLILEWKSDKYGTPVTQEEFLRHGEDGLTALLDYDVPYWIGGHSAGGLLSLAVADRLHPEAVLLVNHARPGIDPYRMIVDAIRGNIEETLHLPTMESMILSSIGVVDYFARGLLHPVDFYLSVRTVSGLPYTSTRMPIAAISAPNDRIFDPATDSLQPNIRVLSDNGKHNLPIRRPRITAKLVMQALEELVEYVQPTLQAA